MTRSEYGLMCDLELRHQRIKYREVYEYLNQMAMEMPLTIKEYHKKLRKQFPQHNTSTIKSIIIDYLL